MVGVGMEIPSNRPSLPEQVLYLFWTVCSLLCFFKPSISHQA